MARAVDNKTFAKIKNTVLGKEYDLSVAYVSPREMRRAGKGKHTSNVLAFPLSQHSGEILLCPVAAKPFSVEYLFIHALLHLKGLKHGATMEREEDRLLKRYHFRRNA